MLGQSETTARTLAAIALGMALTITASSCARSHDTLPGGVTSTGVSANGTGPRLDSYTKPSDAELKRALTPLQYEVTQHEFTETPFNNTFWDNHAAGIYVDVVSGEPLFSSLDKFESGTGWPSFTKPLVPANVKTDADNSMAEARTEVRSAHADSHLGHVFDDGPAPLGLRYCMNSAAMRFIPASKLVAEGYGAYAKLFAASAK